jgi:hypothetical protein
MFDQDHAAAAADDDDDRFQLSPLGHRVQRRFARHVGARRGFRRREDYEQLLSRWTHAHGLRPGDDAYLFELAVGAQTRRELGHGLAVWGHTRHLIAITLSRLVELGFVVQLP